MTQTRNRRIGRKRWGPLIKYLTETMQNSGSERVRMQAALRLADVLTLREQREQLELRRELRMPTTAPDEANEAAAGEEQPASREDAVREARAFLARIEGRESNEHIDTSLYAYFLLYKYNVVLKIV